MLRLLDDGLQIFIETSLPTLQIEQRKSRESATKPTDSLLTPPLDGPPPRGASLQQRHKNKAIYHMKNTRVSYM